LEKLYFGEAGVKKYKGRVGIVQRVLPKYRAPFFDLLAQHCDGGLGVFAGSARPSEHIPLADKLKVAEWAYSENKHLFSGPFYMCVQSGLSKWIDEGQPNVLIMEANTRYLSTPTAIRRMKERSKPVIGWGLGAPQPHGLLAQMQMNRRKRFVMQFDAMIAYSQRGAEEYRALGMPEERVYVAPNAVVPRPIGSPPIRYEKPDHKLTILYVGRLQKRKRLDSLIRVCAALPREIQPKLQIVGDGLSNQELRKLAREIYPQTEFIGSKFGKELDQLFDSADLFVLPGTGGLAIQQAMAHGLPIIAAEGDGSQQDLVQSGNGWLVNPSDDQALKQTLMEALSDPQRLRRMGERSFQLVQDEFNLETMVEAFLQAINDVTN
jgi:glycosyltransferase involved in cell wall biosynthesis